MPPLDDSNPWDAQQGPEPAPEPVVEDVPVEGDDDDEPEDRRRIIAVAAVAFVLIAAVGIFLSVGGDDDDTAGGGGTPTSQGGQGAGGTVTIVGSRDAFDRADTEDGLGALPSGAEWVIDAGGWAVRGGEAVVTSSATKDGQGLRNFATIGTGYEEPQAQVKLAKVVNGAGLAFRYRNPCNHFVVYAVPEYAVWNVEKVVDCKRISDDGSQVFRKITDAPIADGTTVGVVLEGDQVQVVLNGKVVSTFTDDDLVGAGRVGLTVRGPDATEARFDDFVGGGPEGQGIVGGGGGGGGGEGGGSSTTTAPAGTPTTGG